MARAKEVTFKNGKTYTVKPKKPSPFPRAKGARFA